MTANAGHDMEYVIGKSFSQFQHEQQLPELESRLKAVEAGARCCLGTWVCIGLTRSSCQRAGSRRWKRVAAAHSACLTNHPIIFLRMQRRPK